MSEREMSGACFADSFARAKESLERLDTFTILQWSASGGSYPPDAIFARPRRLSIQMVPPKQQAPRLPGAPAEFASSRRCRYTSFAFLSGRLRTGFPVAAWIAFITAGVTTQIVGSPTPPQKS